jgi:hypothetical protein
MTIRLLTSAAAMLLSCFALADVEPSASPEAAQLIESLALRESSTATRDMPGWAPPKQVAVLITGQS